MCTTNEPSETPPAEVQRSKQRNLLKLTAQKPAASNEEFAAFIERAETAYCEMPPNFVLLFDLCKMRALPLAQIRAWLDLFRRVAPVTRARLLCTCVAVQDPVVLTGMKIFMTVYNPIKPLHIFSSRQEALACAVSELESVDASSAWRDEPPPPSAPPLPASATSPSAPASLTATSDARSITPTARYRGDAS